MLFHFGVLFRLYVLRWEYPQVRRLKLLLPIWAAGRRIVVPVAAAGLIRGSVGRRLQADGTGGGELDSQRL